MESSRRSSEWYRKKYPLLFKDPMAEKRALDERYELAWATAKKAATILKDSFAAERVVVFGSLTNRQAFNQWSDIDLAAWGIPANRYFDAVAAVTGFPNQFKIDLVAPDTCKIRAYLREAVEKDGIEI